MFCQEPACHISKDFLWASPPITFGLPSYSPLVTQVFRMLYPFPILLVALSSNHGSMLLLIFLFLRAPGFFKELILIMSYQKGGLVNLATFYYYHLPHFCLASLPSISFNPLCIVSTHWLDGHPIPVSSLTACFS